MFALSSTSLRLKPPLRLLKDLLGDPGRFALGLPDLYTGLLIVLYESIWDAATEPSSSSSDLRLGSIHHLLQLQDQRNNSANKQSSSALYAMGAMQQ